MSDTQASQGRSSAPRRVSKRSVKTPADLLQWYWQRLTRHIEPRAIAWLLAAAVFLLLVFAADTPNHAFRPSSVVIVVAIVAAIATIFVRSLTRTRELRRLRWQGDRIAVLVYAPLALLFLGYVLPANANLWFGTEQAEFRHLHSVLGPGCAYPGRHGCNRQCSFAVADFGALPLWGELRTCLAATDDPSQLKQITHQFRKRTSWVGTSWELPAQEIR
jgi:hypothetical protein